MKIKVTKKHIEKGEPNNSQECAIALAVKEAVGKELAAFAKKCKSPLIEIPEIKEVLVDGDTVAFEVGDNRFEMVASNHIKNFVEAFDDHDMPDIEDYEWIDDPKERKKEFDKDVKGWKKRQALLKPFEFEFKF